MLEQVLLFIASVVANAMSAFAGGGAGLIQLPVILMLGLPFPVALATHKFVTVALGLGAVARLRKEPNLIELKFGLYLLILGMLGAIMGAYFVVQIPDEIAKTVLGLLIIGLGLYSLVKKEMGQTYDPKNRDIKGYIIGGLILFLIGALNGSFTAGTGLFLTIFLVLWFGMDYRRSVACTLMLGGVFWNGAGGLTLVAVGAPIYWHWIPVLLAGSFIGGYIGAHYHTLKGNKWIKIAFVSVTLLSGIALLVR
ncbi:MAG: sulfite exporter TauE/SafE family protein [Alphaproteobacteria bacterium]|nr:sulfite exporter TauE/SafE family protein [Alphaproteobacteria bacterium]